MKLFVIKDPDQMELMLLKAEDETSAFDVYKIDCQQQCDDTPSQETEIITWDAYLNSLVDEAKGKAQDLLRQMSSSEVIVLEDYLGPIL